MSGCAGHSAISHGRALAAVSDRSAKGFFDTLKALDALHDRIK